MSEVLKLFKPMPEGATHRIGNHNPKDTIHTASSLNCFMKCPRLYYYRYELGYRTTADIPALLIGSAVHVGIEHFWLGASYHEAMAKVCDYMDKESSYFRDTPDNKGKIDAARVAAYIKGYYQRWGESKDDYEVIQPELQFFNDGILDEKTKISAACRQWSTGVPADIEALKAKTPRKAGKLDVLMRRKSDNRLVIMEHKTAGPYSKADEAGSPYWQKLGMDTQLCFYIDNVRKITGEDPIVMYDVILKTRSSPLKSKARKKKDEADSAFAARKAADNESLEGYRKRVMGVYMEECKARYFRREINITRAELSCKLQEIETVILQIEKDDDQVRDGHYETRYRNTSSCNSYGSICEFIGVCTGIEVLDDPKFKQKETAHEELKA